MKVKKSNLEDVLNDGEQQALEAFNEHEYMASALKKALLFDLQYNGILDKDSTPEMGRNFALSIAARQPDADEEKIGRDLLIYFEALTALEGAFKEVEKFKKVEEDETEDNPAI